MKKVFFVVLIFFKVAVCLAEPARIDKTAVNTLMKANAETKDGVWLQENCEEYLAWHKNTGSLWLGTDSKKQNLSAGLCTGFIAGVVSALSLEACLKKEVSLAERIVAYLKDNPAIGNIQAVTIVIDVCQNY